MAARQRVLLKKEVVDLVGVQSRYTGESIASIIEDLILDKNITDWLKESYSCEEDKRSSGTTTNTV